MLRRCGTTLAKCPKTLVRLGLKNGDSYAGIQRRVQFNADWVKANHDEYIVGRKEAGAKFYQIDVGQQQRGTVQQITPAEALALMNYDFKAVHGLYLEATEQPSAQRYARAKAESGLLERSFRLNQSWHIQAIAGRKKAGTVYDSF